jgi:hypothetical protein
VFVEPLVLGRDDGVLNVLRHLGDRDHGAVHGRVQLRELLAVAVEQVRRLERRRRVRQLELRVDVQEHRQREDHPRRRDDDEDPPPPLQPAFEAFLTRRTRSAAGATGAVGVLRPISALGSGRG